MSYIQFNLMVWALRLISAAIMLQTLFFKFTAAPESVYIFSALGIEPWGRIVTGFIELIASILLLIPRTTSAGALIASCVMSGALLSHVTRLGIVVQNDGGELFILALIVFAASATLLIIFKKQLRSLLPFYQIKKI